MKILPAIAGGFPDPVKILPQERSDQFIIELSPPWAMVRTKVRYLVAFSARGAPRPLLRVQHEGHRHCAGDG